MYYQITVTQPTQVQTHIYNNLIRFLQQHGEVQIIHILPLQIHAYVGIT